MLRRSCWSVFRRLGLLGLSVGVGCATDTTGPAPLDAAHLYYQLTLNHHAITMALTAPYDTLRLSAIAQSAAGAAVVNASLPTYTVQNGDTDIKVSPTGLLTAVAPDNQAEVVASQTIGNVTHVDTAIVNVNKVSPVPTFTTIMFDPEPGDSAENAIGGCGQGFGDQLTVYALDQNGNKISKVEFKYHYSVNLLGRELQEGEGLMQPSQPGIYPIVAEATVYGVTRTDTLLYSVGWPLTKTIGVIPSTPIGRVTPIGIFVDSYDTVAVGAVVTWNSMLTNQPIDVVFADSSAAQAKVSVTKINDFCLSTYNKATNQGGGNIAAFTPITVTTVDTTASGKIDTTVTITNNTRARYFPTAGTYPYHSALYGTSGVIVVLPEFQGLPLITGTN